MEFIDGETLDALVRRSGPLSVQDTLRVVLQVARALAAAARQSLVHRDIKPANLMVTHEDADEETVVKVIDFGLARAAANAENAPPLTIGGFVGTPQFASPEQLEERPLDARSDLYSLGVTAWFLLTGRVPFSGSLATVCQQQLTQPPPWEHLPTDLTTCVRTLLGRLLEKDPARRPQTAVELRAEIENCLDQVQGSQRRRDLHLPALTAVNGASGKDLAKSTGRSVQAGTLLNGRYRLLREIGDNRGSARVYQARDESNAGTTVAVKILPEEISSSTALRSRWEEAARLAQAAPHPNLVRIVALERSLAPDAVFLVEEWVAGWTLRDLLAGRGGALPVTETLRLLSQAAAAADHADRCGLEHLDLGGRHLHICFPAEQTSAEHRAILPRSMADWPDWTLKTHAIRFAEDPLGLDTWAGGETLLPATHSHVGMRSTGSAVQEGSYVPALARLVYELLGGRTPGHRPGPDSPQTRYALLPALNEAANSLLRATLSGEVSFVHGWQWQEAFVKVVGDGPARGETPVPVATPVHPTPPDDLPPSEDDVEPSPNSAFAPEGGATVFHDAHASVEPESGSAWDRLTLVGEKRAHPGRWVAGMIGLAAVFGLVFVAVLAWLLQQPPARSAVLAPTTKTRAPERATVPASRLASTRLATPAPLVAAVSVTSPTVRPSVVPTPLPATVRIEGTPTPAPTALARVENIPPTPIPTETPPVPPRERSTTMVRMDSVPEGAQIRLGDEILGVTPCRVRLPHGDHQLIARYQDWPETRQTIHLDGTETRLAVEIRLMRPDLVPGLTTPPPATLDMRARRIPAPAAHHAVPIQPGSPTPAANEPEVRPAQRVLTPFLNDEAENASPSAQPTPINKQPFSVDDPDGN